MSSFFCAQNDAEKVTQLLYDLFAWAGESSPAAKNLRIYHVHELFFQLSHTAGVSILGNYKEAALIKLESEEFLYSPGFTIVILIMFINVHSVC